MPHGFTVRECAVDLRPGGVLRMVIQRPDGSESTRPPELASYCMHALAGAGAQRSKAAVRRLLSVTLDGFRPPG
jgi:uncharacterized protein YndB with AHSA1/START domain